MATAALVLGIVSVVVSFIPGVNWLGSVCGVVAIVFGALEMKKAPDDKKGHAKVGFILGIVAVGIGIIATIVCTACLGATAAAFDSLY